MFQILTGIRLYSSGDGKKEAVFLLLRFCPRGTGTDGREGE